MTKNELRSNAPHANICLLLEGTFPYVRGGVSTWVKQIIEGLPHLTFSIIYLGAESTSLGEPAYALPDNVVHLETHFLIGEKSETNDHTRWAQRIKSFVHKSVNRDIKSSKFSANNTLHTQLQNTRGTLDKSVVHDFGALLAGQHALTEKDLNEDKRAWETIREKYNDAPEGLDFNHFFWTIRSMHAPLFVLADIARSAPAADVYHSVSTGYAGFLGSMLHSATAKPFIISEHGIYTKERELDLAQVDWIPEAEDPYKVGLNDNMNYLRSVWIRFFFSLGRMSYSSANRIFTLYEGNRQRQIADGANEDRLSIIPNGVDVSRFARVRRDREAPIPPVLALIGRVVPIKDIKTFIRAMQIINSELPDAQGWLYGPEDEDEGYAKECHMLVDSLGLNDVVKFKGFGKPDDIFPGIGLTVLTSVSEGQPLVVLEGFAAGIPALTTDVGSCRELIEGVTEADRLLGSAGSVVPIANAELFAKDAVALLSDASFWHSASDVAIARVERFYDEKQMIDRYQQVYQEQMNVPDDCQASRKAA
ncbi:GT4 family glycosyltransferase PelF [Granulosicoccus sp.]|nr:GT4 family glycosyltransferase PelF [Granulosicoccus sp.]